MDFVTLTVDFLKILSHICGNNYGLAIILLTIIVRVAMWPLSVTQQRSMKKMQELQPKMKLIQERYKSDPQTMQRKLMEVYKEHNANPMSGCLPLLIQMPIFILLYSALMSPQFIQVAGNSNFFMLKRLDATLRGQAGMPYDGKFNVSNRDNFSINSNVKVYLDKQILDDVKLSSKRALKVQGDIIPSQNIDFKISLDELNLKYSQLEKVKKIEATVSDNTTREAETVTFVRNGNILSASVPTNEVKTTFNFDVFILIVLFGLTMFFSQKVMTMTNKNIKQDPQQEQMQKMLGTTMPIMLTATFAFIPIPAGVLLYLIASNIIQIGQTVMINKQIEIEDEKRKQSKTADVAGAKPIEAKEVKNIENDKN